MGHELVDLLLDLCPWEILDDAEVDLGADPFGEVDVYLCLLGVAHHGKSTEVHVDALPCRPHLFLFLGVIVDDEFGHLLPALVDSKLVPCLHKAWV